MSVSRRDVLRALGLLGASAGVGAALGIATRGSLGEPWRLSHRLVTPAEPGRFTLLSAGDTLLGQGATGRIERKGPDWTFDLLRPHLDADARMLNLETPVTVAAAEPPIDKAYVHRMRPEYLPAVAAAGFDLVSLANNHGGDQGGAGIIETLEHLAECGIAGVGAGRDLTAAERPFIYEVEGNTPMRVAVIGFQEPRRDLESQGFFATPAKAGINRFDVARASAQIAALKADVDFVIATIHWGGNYRDEFIAQRQIAGELVAAGVDLINGHGAHRAQAVELIDGVPVIYSLGNFVFGAGGRYKKISPQMRLSLVARYVFEGKQLTAIELLPIRTDNHKVKYQPRVAGAGQAKRELEPRLSRYGVNWERRADGWYVIRLPQVPGEPQPLPKEARNPSKAELKAMRAREAEEARKKGEAKGKAKSKAEGEAKSEAKSGAEGEAKSEAEDGAEGGGGDKKRRGRAGAGPS